MVGVCLLTPVCEETGQPATLSTSWAPPSHRKISQQNLPANPNPSICRSIPSVYTPKVAYSTPIARNCYAVQLNKIVSEVLGLLPHLPHLPILPALPIQSFMLVDILISIITLIMNIKNKITRVRFGYRKPEWGGQNGFLGIICTSKNFVSFTKQSPNSRARNSKTGECLAKRHLPITSYF